MKKQLSERQKNHLEKLRLLNIANPEFGKKISIGNSGKKRKPHKRKSHSKETRDKIGLANNGRKWTDEMKSKIKGRPNPTKGIKRPKTCGEKHHNWKGGVSGFRGQLYHSIEYRQWRSDVFQRDNYTCVWCGTCGYKLEADHIVPFSYIVKKYNIKTVQQGLDCNELWNINNGRTLCKECHKKTDTYLVKANKYGKE